ncbi:MAG: nitrogenase iron-molybdenum cofactor biosynthesis protein NifE [Nitrospirae bacterium]|nr:nitrogenase iron-molybdenum cofactor biosynthesis protein NifE [Nitrospirota bacterium]
MRLSNADRLIKEGCNREKKDKLCRSRGGESCAFDGAMIVLQPIADAAHIVHGPIACCGNSWEGRGTLSSKGNLYRMGFTTDMTELDIVYGSEDKLYRAILRTYEAVGPSAVFVYATCVSGLTGEDIEAVCRKAEATLGVRVIPVNAPGFTGPKNLGNRIAGEVLLDYVIGTGEAPLTTTCDINLIGEYNIAGDLWLVEPLLKEAGIRVLSRITGDSTFEEITYAHRADLNVVVCSRALVNVAKEMQLRYDIPYIEVSFFGKTEMTKALRAIGSRFKVLSSRIEEIIQRKERELEERLKEFSHLKGKKAVLYTGGVKSWSFISALLDLEIEIVAVGTKKSTYEDEEKMREILGEDAPLVEDVTPSNLRRLMKDNNADILIAGGRNLYLAMKEGFPFVDVNQERHRAYAGYEGLVNLAEDISNSIRFFSQESAARSRVRRQESRKTPEKSEISLDRDLVINPLKHSQSVGAAIALQGIDRALPVIHSAQGCSFLAKVLITKHFREPVALVSTKLFTEDIVMGSEERLVNVIEGIIEKQQPDIIGILSSGLSEVRGEDMAEAIKRWQVANGRCKVVHVSTPDYAGGLETGYAKAVEAILESIECERTDYRRKIKGQVNLLVGSHLTPADFTEIREIIESFGLRPVLLPDLAALDGSRQDFSSLASGGTRLSEIKRMGSSEFTIAIGKSMEAPAKKLREIFGSEYILLESISGLRDTDALMDILSTLSGRAVPHRYKRQRRVLIDGMRDVHFYFGGKKFCIALEPDLSVQVSRLIQEMGAVVDLVVIPCHSGSVQRIFANEVRVGDLSSIDNRVFDVLISNSHGELAAKRLGIPLYQMGFPVYKIFGYTTKITIGYRGTLGLINDMANLLKEVH